ncbi:MAG: DUF3822 family protein [Bacteroidales bacterium]|nr:DUF3822 family protein [Bacteroidales bacterium]
MKCTLVPSNFFDENCAGEYLAQVFVDAPSEPVRSVLIPEYNAYLVWASGAPEGEMPRMYDVLSRLGNCPDYNKILCSWDGAELCLAIAQGKTLLLANTYEANDFTTAEYWIFLALRSLQLNPEISTICLLSEISPEDEMSLYRYFKAVETL